MISTNGIPEILDMSSGWHSSLISKIQVAKISSGKAKWEIVGNFAFLFLSIFSPLICWLIDWLIGRLVHWLIRKDLTSIGHIKWIWLLLILTNNQIFIVVWQCGQLESLGVQTDCFTQLHLSHPEELGMLLTTPYVVCGTGCDGAAGRAPGGHTRSLSKQVFALIKVAQEMKY